jgi:hypothetical protein
MENQNLKKRLYQNLLNKSPRHNNMLENNKSDILAELKPKIIQDTILQSNKKS